jgi:hypothetical protein
MSLDCSKMGEVSRNNQDHQGSRGKPEAPRMSKAVFLIPAAILIGTVLAVGTTHTLSHGSPNPAVTSVTLETSKSLATDAGNTTSPKLLGAQIGEHSSKTQGTPITPKPTQSQPVSSNPTPQPASIPSAAPPTTGCTTLIQHLSDALTSSSAAAKALLRHNLTMVGLDLGLQNKFIDGYNKYIQDTYDSSAQSAKDAGCILTTPAPAVMSHKKLL